MRYDEGFSNVPRPVFAHGLVFIATGFQQPSLLAVRPDGTGDVTKTHIAWSLTRGAPLTPSPLIVGDELYVVNDGGIASCIDARSGTVIWQQRLGGAADALWFVKLNNLGDVLAYNAGSIRTARELAPAGARALQAGVRLGF